MSTDAKLRELLAPLTEPEDNLASRRVAVDREKIISRMVDVSLVPEARFGKGARFGMALALAASFALASWGGWHVFQQRAGAEARMLEVVALRGSVRGAHGAKSSGLELGTPVKLSAEGTLETSEGSEARIKTSAGLEINLLEDTQVSLGELGAEQGSAALRLQRGRVRCVIPHRPGRTFAVITSAARIVDVGTTFSVSIAPDGGGSKTIVHVEEGEVLVQYAGGESRLTASQSWTSASAYKKSEPVVPSVEAPSEPAPVAPSARRSPARPRPPTLATETELLQSGLASEQKGDLQAAATAFETLVARYPRSQLAPDAKAALARVKGRLESSK